MNRAFLHLSLAAVLATFSACAGAISPYALATAGPIGCPAEHIALGRVHHGEGAPQAWIASCGRAHYACSSNGDPRRPHTRVICRELEDRPQRRAISWRR